MERFVILRPCMYGVKSYSAGQIISGHITGEHLLALGFAARYVEDNQTDATESDPTPSRRPAADDKE